MNVLRIAYHKLHIGDWVSRIAYWGSRIENCILRITHRELYIEDRVSRIEIWGSRITYLERYEENQVLFCCQGEVSNKENEEIQLSLDDYALEPWSSKRLGILSKYTTSEKLSITTVSQRKGFCFSIGLPISEILTTVLTNKMCYYLYSFQPRLSALTSKVVWGQTE